MAGGFVNWSGVRLVVESDETDENDTEGAGAMAPYFDTERRLILEHDGMSYLIES